MTLPHSDACFVAAYPAATTEAWLDGHNRAFVFFGGVPQSILYDNDKCLVSRILSDGTRQRTRAFSGLQSHYLFEDRYGRPGKGNDKGNVEGVVGYARRNFMTPLPRFASWDAFNGHLEEQCRNRQGNVLRGHRESIGERFVRDREALKRPLPAPFDACDKQGTRVNSLSLVRYRTNDYSVPVAYGHQEVWIRGYVHEVVIGCGAGIIARHPRSYDREDMVFDPIHYLPLLEHKIGALDQAAPLAGWELPDAFPTLRRLLEARMGKAGKREYVQVLRLVETFDLEVLHGAVKDALRLGAIGYDAVKHLVLCRIERRPPKLDLDIYPEISHAPLPSHESATHRRPILWSQETINDAAAETRPRRPPTSSSRGQERGTWVVTTTLHLIGILDVKGLRESGGAVAPRRLTGLDPVPRQVRRHCRDVEAGDLETEMIHVAALGARRRTALAADLAVGIDEID